MKPLVCILALLAAIALTGCSQTDGRPQTDSRPKLIVDWSDELLEDELMNYNDDIKIIKDEQKRRASPEPVL